MIRQLSCLAMAATAALLACCDRESESAQVEPRTSPPEPLTPEVRAALEAQPVGRRLLGNTEVFVGDAYVPAELNKAPEYYLIHYSASY